MAANGITDAEANTLLDLSVVTSSTVDLVSAMGTATAAPTKVIGGSYAAQTPAWAAAASRAKSNSGTVTFSGLPTVGGSGVLGVDISRPSAGARSWFMPFTTGKPTTAGDSMIFSAAGIVASFINGT